MARPASARSGWAPAPAPASSPGARAARLDRTALVAARTPHGSRAGPPGAPPCHARRARPPTGAAPRPAWAAGSSRARSGRRSSESSSSESPSLWPSVEASDNLGGFRRRRRLPASELRGKDVGAHVEVAGQLVENLADDAPHVALVVTEAVQKQVQRGMRGTRARRPVPWPCLRSTSCSWSSAQRARCCCNVAALSRRGDRRRWLRRLLDDV